MSAGPLIRDLVTWYTEEHALHRVKPRTLQRYRQVLGDLVLFLSRNHCGRLQQLSFGKLQEWLVWYADRYPGRQDDGEHSPVSQRTYLTLVKTFLNACERHGKIEQSPIRYWDLPRKPRKVKYNTLSATEVREVLDILHRRSPSIWNLCRFLAYSGWHLGDARDLRWGDIHGDMIKRCRVKTEIPLWCPITATIQEILNYERVRLDAPPRPEDPIFRTTHGRPWGKNTVYTQLTRTLCAEGFPKHVSPKTFRTTYATLAAHADPPVPVKVLQRQLGHSDVQTTLNYYVDVQESAFHRGANVVASLFDASVEESSTSPNNDPE